MAEVAQYSFALKEVAVALVKTQGIHEGRWAIGFEFGLGAGVMGPSAAEVRPSAIIGINNIVLLRMREGEPELPFEINALEVNPKK